MTLAGTWELPVGRGRAFASQMPRVLDYVIGGWDLSGHHDMALRVLRPLWRNAGRRRPARRRSHADRWFNTAAFKQLPAFTPRTNPLQYEGLTNPGLFNLDMSIVKRMPVTEKYRVELRMDVFNAANNMTWANPNTNVLSSLFGSHQQPVGQHFRTPHATRSAHRVLRRWICLLAWSSLLKRQPSQKTCEKRRALIGKADARSRLRSMRRRSPVRVCVCCSVK